MIVAIDTSSSVTVVGTGSAEKPGQHGQVEGGRRHAEAIDGLFADVVGTNRADIEAVAVGIGPGPYSGLRVGIAFGVGLGRALDVPVVGVCSLDMRAWQVAGGSSGARESDFSIASDARRGEVYWADYRHDGRSLPHRLSGPRVIASEDIESAKTVYRDVVIDAALMAHHVGREISLGVIAVEAHPVLVPHGDDASLHELGAGPLFTPTPLYLRQPDVTLSAIPDQRS